MEIDYKRNGRRTMLKKSGVVLASLAAIPVVGLSRSARADSAMRAAFHYQDQPKDGQQCSSCTAYVAMAQDATTAGGCRVIEGQISPRGWCMAYSKKN